MGYMRHHAILVTTWKDEAAFASHCKAMEIFGAGVSALTGPATNGYRSFAVFPDGSKEGWAESAERDVARATFIDSLAAYDYEDGSSPLDWVEVQYGDDDWETIIVRDSDEKRRVQALLGTEPPKSNCPACENLGETVECVATHKPQPAPSPWIPVSRKPKNGQRCFIGVGKEFYAATFWEDHWAVSAADAGIYLPDDVKVWMPAPPSAEPSTCPRCEGTGKYSRLGELEKACAVCDGTGQIHA